MDNTNRFAYSANLGANQVLQFAFDAKTGKLTPLDPSAVKPEAGHGPRHLAVSRDNKFLYVLNELSGHVTQYAIDGRNGTLKLVDSVPSVPPELGMKWGQPQVPVGASRRGACRGSRAGREATDLGRRSAPNAEWKISLFD